MMLLTVPNMASSVISIGLLVIHIKLPNETLSTPPVLGLFLEAPEAILGAPGPQRPSPPNATGSILSRILPDAVPFLEVLPRRAA
mmetsp:Transcript_28362/g.34558  ORF Transcript_28362/g.34558 Transcript_28362/m.34558 type:complete len:85 (-) Transcript_28362:1196-1450(-)